MLKFIFNVNISQIYWDYFKSAPNTRPSYLYLACKVGTLSAFGKHAEGRGPSKQDIDVTF
jgi:hypothetical protein